MPEPIYTGRFSLPEKARDLKVYVSASEKIEPRTLVMTLTAQKANGELVTGVDGGTPKGAVYSKGFGAAYVYLASHSSREATARHQIDLEYPEPVISLETSVFLWADGIRVPEDKWGLKVYVGASLQAAGDVTVGNFLTLSEAR